MVNAHEIHPEGDCHHCGGIGMVFGKSGLIDTPCQRCNGTGRSNTDSQQQTRKGELIGDHKRFPNYQK